MRKFEKRLVFFAILFVIVYLVAAGLSIHSKISRPDKTIAIESAGPQPGESQMMLAELLLPMLILLTIAVCFFIVKKKRQKDILRLEEEDEDLHRFP
jgi:hypothetical protein